MNNIVICPDPECNSRYTIKHPEEDIQCSCGGELYFGINSLINFKLIDEHKDVMYNRKFFIDDRKWLMRYESEANKTYFSTKIDFERIDYTFEGFVSHTKFTQLNILI